MKLDAFQFQFANVSYNDTYCIGVFVGYEFQLYVPLSKSNVSYKLKHVFNANQNLCPDI